MTRKTLPRNPPSGSSGEWNSTDQRRPGHGLRVLASDPHSESTTRSRRGTDLHSLPGSGIVTGPAPPPSLVTLARPRQGTRCAGRVARRKPPPPRCSESESPAPRQMPAGLAGGGGSPSRQRDFKSGLSRWWSLTAAFSFMFVLVLAANLFADVVRDAFDPRLRMDGA